MNESSSEIVPVPRQSPSLVEIPIDIWKTPEGVCADFFYQANRAIVQQTISRPQKETEVNEFYYDQFSRLPKEFETKYKEVTAGKRSLFDFMKFLLAQFENIFNRLKNPELIQAISLELQQKVLPNFPQLVDPKTKALSAKKLHDLLMSFGIGETEEFAEEMIPRLFSAGTPSPKSSNLQAIPSQTA